MHGKAVYADLNFKAPFEKTFIRVVLGSLFCVKVGKKC